MKQKYFIIGGFILLIALIFITGVLNRWKNSSSEYPSPTKIPPIKENLNNYNLSFKNQWPNEKENLLFFSPTPSIISDSRQALKEFTNLLLFDTAINHAFSSSISPELSPTISHTKKLTNQQAKTDNRQQNNHQSPTDKNARAFLHDIFYLLFFPGSTTVSNQYHIDNSFITPSVTPTNKNRQSTTDNRQPIAEYYIHYPQCNGNFDNYPLPDGCNLCQAGCGPTTVAMILSSFIDKKITPIKVVEMYKQKGLYAGCQGTKVGDAQQILNENGIQTTDLLYYGNSTKQETIEDFKQYLNNGWTLFTLARFCEKGCGHFFWIVNIDEKNQVWAYDPTYGQAEIPFNENRYDPWPKYYVAFGVKKL